MERITHCRSCGSDDLHIVLDLGRQPVANALLTKEKLREPEPMFPLELVRCNACTILQVGYTVPAEVLYQRDYPYFSSSSNALLKHASDHVDELMRTRDLGPDSLVIEVASNDGYLLKNFVAAGVPVLGIDPADGPAKKANSIGVPTRCTFFNSALADQLVAEGKLADVTIASNVVAHVDNINDFVAGFKKILKPDGVAIFEFAYAVDTIQHLEFDQIYHEHLFYHHLHGLRPLFERHGLYLQDAVHLDIHGGSLRIYVGHENRQTVRLQMALHREFELGVDGPDYYKEFGIRVRQSVDSLRELLLGIKHAGYKIACYGAAAKGATLTNYMNLGEGFFEFVADQNPNKQGKFMPGQKIPIVHPDRLMTDQPRFCLLLVWNFAEEVLKTYLPYRQTGACFIIPGEFPRIETPPDLPKVDWDVRAEAQSRH